MKVGDTVDSNNIGNWDPEHPLTRWRCEKIADAIKFISTYESQNGGRLVRERDELRRLMYPFTCDAPDSGKDGVKYSLSHHCHTDSAKKIVARYPKSYLQKYLRHEHAVPRAVIEDKLFKSRSCQLGCTTAVANILSKYLHVVVLTVDEDKALKAHGLNSKMPLDWDGINPYSRYKVAGISLCDPLRAS